jgi:hypothetical protein
MLHTRVIQCQISSLLVAALRSKHVITALKALYQSGLGHHPVPRNADVFQSTVEHARLLQMTQVAHTACTRAVRWCSPGVNDVCASIR